MYLVIHVLSEHILSFLKRPLLSAVLVLCPHIHFAIGWVCCLFQYRIDYPKFPPVLDDFWLCIYLSNWNFLLNYPVSLWYGALAGGAGLSELWTVRMNKSGLKGWVVVGRRCVSELPISPGTGSRASWILAPTCRSPSLLLSDPWGRLGMRHKVLYAGSASTQLWASNSLFLGHLQILTSIVLIHGTFENAIFKFLSRISFSEFAHLLMHS